MMDYREMVEMTREITISIEGLQPGQAQDSIRVKAQGTYDIRNGMHYIHYEEVSEDNGDISSNLIKISTQRIEMIKKGSISTQMSFDLRNDTKALYQTPFGNLNFNIHTVYLKVKEREEELIAELHYSLSSEEDLISDNAIIIKVSPQN